MLGLSSYFPNIDFFAFLQPYVGSVLPKNVTIRKVINLPTLYKGNIFVTITYFY